MSSEKELSQRLSGAIPYVTRGGRVADIGTDHAYLPIELIRRGILESALAGDIGEGPIARARAHIEAAGLSKQIQTVQTDGLRGVESYEPTDVIIFGMGGELIAKILSDAPWVREKQVNLILQPMTKADVLRRYLNENGFEILDESLIYEDRYYQIIHARQTGRTERYTEVELLLGRKNLNGSSPYLKGFLERHAELLSDILEGKRQGDADTAAEEALLADIQKRRNAISKEDRE